MKHFLPPKEWQRVFPVIEEDTDYEYTTLIRLERTYEQQAQWSIVVDISNGDRPGRVLKERKDKLPRLPEDFEKNVQQELIDAVITEINMMTNEQLDHIENNKIGFRYRQNFMNWALLPEE